MSQTATKKKAIALAKLIAKERAGWICEKCGKSKAQGYLMHGAHIMPVTWAKTAADPDNILCLCGTCHSIGRDSQHQNAIPFARWFDSKWPGRYDKLDQIARTYSQNPFPKIDWEEVLMKLKELANVKQ